MEVLGIIVRFLYRYNRKKLTRWTVSVTFEFTDIQNIETDSVCSIGQCYNKPSKEGTEIGEKGCREEKG